MFAVPDLQIYRYMATAEPISSSSFQDRISMASRTTGWLTNSRGQRLYCVNFEPARPICRLFFHHGLAEHISRYENIFSRMSSNGVAIHSFDAHGHGRSEPSVKAERALVWQFKHLVSTSAAALPRPCWTALSHSFTGWVFCMGICRSMTLSRLLDR